MSNECARPAAPEGAEAEGVLPSTGLQEAEEEKRGETRGESSEETPSV